MTKKITRRAALTAVGSGAGLASCAAVAPALMPVSGPVPLEPLAADCAVALRMLVHDLRATTGDTVNIEVQIRNRWADRLEEIIGPVGKNPDVELLCLYDEYRAAFLKGCRLSDTEWEKANEYFRKTWGTADEIVKFPAHTMAGLSAKFDCYLGSNPRCGSALGPVALRSIARDIEFEGQYAELRLGDKL
jgi:hypothetical protein